MQYANVNAIVEPSLECAGNTLSWHSLLLLNTNHVRLVEYHELAYSFHVQDFLVGYLERWNTIGIHNTAVVKRNASGKSGVNPADLHLAPLTLCHNQGLQPNNTH
jgi:hypothetical protein